MVPFASIVKEQAIRMQMNRSIQMTGCLELELNHQLISIEAHFDQIKLTFSSMQALLKFVSFYRQVESSQLSHLSSFVNQLNIVYFIDHSKIGESGPTVKPSWIGQYLGMKRMKIQLNVLLKLWFHHFLNIKAS